MYYHSIFSVMTSRRKFLLLFISLFILLIIGKDVAEARSKAGSGRLPHVIPHNKKYNDQQAVPEDQYPIENRPPTEEELEEEAEEAEEADEDEQPKDEYPAEIGPDAEEEKRREEEESDGEFYEGEAARLNDAASGSGTVSGSAQVSQDEGIEILQLIVMRSVNLKPYAILPIYEHAQLVNGRR